MRIAVGRCPDQVSNGQKPAQKTPFEHQKLAEKLAARDRRSARERTRSARVAGGHFSASCRRVDGRTPHPVSAPGHDARYRSGGSAHARCQRVLTAQCREPSTPTSARRSLTARSKDCTSRRRAREMRVARTARARRPGVPQVLDDPSRLTVERHEPTARRVEDQKPRPARCRPRPRARPAACCSPRRPRWRSPPPPSWLGRTAGRMPEEQPDSEMCSSPMAARSRSERTGRIRVRTCRRAKRARRPPDAIRRRLRVRRSRGGPQRSPGLGRR